ncbi:MAG: NDP-sugar synthase, partial [Halobacteria archaeon]|nr:NDP-sugar synthase [Halobacteria archaeon]
PGFFLEWLYTRENVYSYVFDGAWFDIGTPESYIRANAHLLDGDTLVEDGVEIENSNVGENSYVMSGATLENSDVANTIVFGDAHLSNCTIRDSIIDRKTVVDGMDFQNALIGEHTQLNGEIEE